MRAERVLWAAIVALLVFLWQDGEYRRYRLIGNVNRAADRMHDHALVSFVRALHEEQER